MCGPDTNRSTGSAAICELTYGEPNNDAPSTAMSEMTMSDMSNMIVDKGVDDGTASWRFGSDDWLSSAADLGPP